MQWVDQLYTPYLDERKLKHLLNPRTLSMVHKLEEAVLMLTKTIVRGLKAAENEWDARDPIKV